MKQTLIALVEDKPGVLNRVASLFRRRNFNIESLTVGHSETPGVSRMTFVVNEPDFFRRNIIVRSLIKLINVIDVKDVSQVPCVVRESVLVKAKSDTEGFKTIQQLSGQLGFRVIDQSEGTVIVEAMDEAQNIDVVIEQLKPFGILEIVRTGRIAMRRGQQSQGESLQPLIQGILPNGPVTS